MIRKSIWTSSLALVGCAWALSSAGPALGDPAWPSARTVEVTYSIGLPKLPEGTQRMRVWVPLASTRDGQKILRRQIEAPFEYRITRDATFDNEMLYAEVNGTGSDTGSITVRYQVEINKALLSKGGPEEKLQKYLKPSSLVVQNANIAQRAARATEDKTSLPSKARGIYDSVIESMSYDKIAPGWGKGDSARACAVGKGNCTDFHSLFISMAHVANIPARFKIGFQVPEGEEGKINGYHCWAEFYDEEQGWKPIDASEAWKKPQMKDAYFGGFDPNKFIVSMGRDIQLVPQQAGGNVNIFFYPHVEVDGEEVLVEDLSFSFKKL